MTSGAAVTFDATPSTYWTLDQTNANTEKHSWALRPNGTAGVSLNNNGSYSADCPWMKINGHNSTSQNCNLWIFDDGKVNPAERMPSLPENMSIAVSSVKADFLVPATDADDNDHWYIMTQARDGETPMYDNGTATLKRAVVDTNVNAQPIAGNEKYLIRFFETETDGVYNIQFATGKYITENLTTGSYNEAGNFNVYNINGEASHIGWNKFDFANIVDNNGANSTLAYWESGRVTRLNGNNDWNLYSVAFGNIVTISYSLRYDVLDEPVTGQYSAVWADEMTLLPAVSATAGCTFENVEFAKVNNQYTLTADVKFPFPLSTAEVKNATGIQSDLGISKWFVNSEGEIVANNQGKTNIVYSNQNDFKWYIYYNGYNEGVFSFKIQHSTGKYIPTIEAAQSANTHNSLTDEENAGVYYLTPCTRNGAGFSINETGTIFLTINSGNGDTQYIWTWTKSANSGHEGSNLSFPNVTITKEEVSEKFDRLKVATPFDILDGSIVVGPREFDAPEEINSAIEKAKEIDAEEIEEEAKYCKMDDFNHSAEAQKIKNYLDQVATYGELYTYPFDVTRQYSTLILPCPSTLPAGITLYGCSSTEDNGETLVLSPVSGDIVQNVPYIIESTVGSKYTIIGWLKNHEDTHTSGWLTGVLAENGALVPEGGYALAYQKSTGKQGFFKTDGTVTCPQHKCYLTPTVEQAAKAFYFDNNGGTTAIEDIFGGNDGKMEIYDLSGRRLQSLQKGVNIVNGRKMLVK